MQRISTNSLFMRGLIYACPHSKKWGGNSPLFCPRGSAGLCSTRTQLFGISASAQNNAQISESWLAEQPMIELKGNARERRSSIFFSIGYIKSIRLCLSVCTSVPYELLTRKLKQTVPT